jgi:GAF domain-containing protein
LDLQQLHAAVKQLTDLSTTIAAITDPREALAVVTAATIDVLDRADSVSISEVRDGRFRTLAPTDELSDRVDRLQYELGSGPCVDAALEETVYRSGDIGGDERWPEFGRRAAEQGVASMLAVRIFLEDDGATASLNCYARTPQAFGEEDEARAQLLAVYGGMAISAVAANAEARALTAALQSNRDIGVAIGVLMSRYLFTRDQAFDMLRLASQRSHRKLRQIALDVVETGDLPIGGRQDPR